MEIQSNWHKEGFCLHRALAWLGCASHFDLKDLGPWSLICQVRPTKSLVIAPYLVDYRESQNGLMLQGAKANFADWLEFLPYMLTSKEQGLLSLYCPKEEQAHVVGFRPDDSQPYKIEVGPDAQAYKNWQLRGIFLILDLDAVV